VVDAGPASASMYLVKLFEYFRDGFLLEHRVALGQYLQVDAPFLLLIYFPSSSPFLVTVVLPVNLSELFFGPWPHAVNNHQYNDSVHIPLSTIILTRVLLHAFLA
jgi:hypothetical protein